MDRVECARRSRGVKEDALRDGATVDLARRQSFDHDHRSATARTRPCCRWRRRFDGRRHECLTRPRGKRTPAQWEIVCAATMREKPTEANADETLGQDVQEESPEKFDGTDRHGPRLTAVPVVLPLKGDAAVSDVEDPMIRDGHAVRVAREVLQHMRGAAEGWLGVDDPVVPKESSQEGAERRASVRG